MFPDNNPLWTENTYEISDVINI